MMDIVKALIVSCDLTKCRLSVTNEVMSDVLLSTNERNLEQTIKDSMAKLLAREMMTKGTMVSQDINSRASKVFTMKVWSFTDEQLRKLVECAIDIGEKGKVL